jgi:pimeloyl-ACP methyl ester carboxylesterase
MSAPFATREVAAGDDRTLTVYEGGRPDGSPVFTLHGTPASGLPYERHLELAARQGIRLVSYDRSGYGGSTPRPDRAVVDAADEVAAVADELGIERFAVWGISGGGPHALACAARLGGSVAAVASLAGVTPYPIDGLDWMEGMGDANIEEFGLALEGRERVTPWIEEHAEEIRRASADDLAATMRTLLGPPDLAVLTGDFAEFLLENNKLALAGGVDGWVDDDLAFTKPWGFELNEIEVPVLILHGRTDRFVPFAHGEWLAEHVPGAEPWLTDEDGHLTLFANRVEAVHEWLLTRF